jgi:hypothetical protein
LLIQMKLALAERKRSVCTSDTLFYWLLTFLQCNYHRDLRQLWQRVCWPLCSCGSSIYLSHTTAALYRTSWCKQRSRRRRKSAFTSNSVFTNRTQTLFCVKLCLSSLSTLHCRSLFLLLRELLCPQVEATSLLRRISPLHIYFLCLRQGAAPA